MLNELENLRRKVDELEGFKAKCEQLGKSLQESEERFVKLFHASSNLMAISTIKDGRMVDLNEASAGLGGYKREELIGSIEAERSLWVDPKQRDKVIQKLQEEGRVRNLEVDVYSKSGDIRRVLFSADPITVNDEACLLSVSVDITAREKAADVLRNSEEQYRMLVENSLQGLAIIQDGRIIFCSNAYAAISGYSVEELLSFPNTNALIHRDDLEFVKERYRQRLAGKPNPPRYEHRIIRKDGTVRWVEIHASFMEYNGKPATQIVDLDITDRKLAEEALKESKEYLNQIINCIGDQLFVMDRKHKFILANDASCAFNGMRREDLLGKSADDFLPKEQAISLWEQEESIFQTGRGYITEDNFADGQGNSRTLMTNRSLLTDKSGNEQIICVSRDITEYKRLESQFLQAQKMEAIGVLAGGVAHDFNNLLNVINGYSELVLEKVAQDDRIRRDVEQIWDAGCRAATLTSQLLTFGRKQILQPEILDLNNVIEQLSSMLRRLIGEDIEFASITQPGLGLVNADPGQIQQIVMNLAVNARDAMPKGGKMTIETANVDLDEDYVRRHPVGMPGPYVMLAISDNGIGMDAATQGRIFEPFFTTKEKGKGTGLGLSTVYGIVKQSNGFIWVYSELGKGTAFKIYFPRAEGEITKDTAKAKPESGFRGSEIVLVVEDDDSVRALACRILRERGYNVLEAPDGMEALRIAQEFAGEIRMILTDAVMPGMSGRELVSRLEVARPGIKSLFVSGYTDNAIVHHGMLDSNIAFLQKPFTVESLARKVREALNS